MSKLGGGLMLPLALVAMAGCDELGLGPTGDVPMTLSFAVEPRAGLAAAGAEGGLSLTSTAETLTLSTVSLHVEELVLEREEGDANVDSDGDSETDSDSDGGANEKFVVNGAIIDLPLDGGVITPLSQPVPAGRYEEIEIDIMSVRLVGAVDGEAFDVLIPVDLELEMDFEPPVEVSGDETFNITVSVDPLAWLENPDGTFIDPRDLATDGSLMNLVRQRMALTFDAFEDSDHDADSEDSDSDSG